MCQHFAKEYNSRGVPKKVNFLDAFAVECFQRHGNPMLACETLMKGNYTKFNNNYGASPPPNFLVYSGMHSLLLDPKAVSSVSPDGGWVLLQLAPLKPWFQGRQYQCSSLHMCTRGLG